MWKAAIGYENCERIVFEESNKQKYENYDSA